MGAFTGTFVGGSNTITTSGAFSISGSATRTINLTSTTIVCAVWTATTTTGLTFTSTSSSITVNGAGGTVNGGGLSYGTMIISGSGNPTLAGANTFVNLTRTGTAVTTDLFSISADQTITTTLTLNSNSSINRLQFASSVVGTPRTITAAAVVVSNIVDFMDITGAGAATWTVAGTGATALGDAGGNSGITFTTPVTQTATGTSSFNWSTHGWTTRVPLPQDDVVVNLAFSATQTITADMPRLGRSVSFAGSTGSPTFSLSTNINVFGSLTYASGMTVSGAFSLVFRGRSAYTLTTAGATLTVVILQIVNFGGTLTLLDNLTQSGSTIGISLQVQVGCTLTATTQNVTLTDTAGRVDNSGTINLGTGTWSLGGTAAANTWNSTGTTNGLQGEILLANTSTNTRVFVGGGGTYGTLTYIVAGSTGQLTVTGSNYFGKISFKDSTNARTLQFTSGQTNVIINRDIVGTSGKLMTVSAVTGASPTTLVSLRKWFIGANSTVGTGNTGLTAVAGADMDFTSFQDVTGQATSQLSSGGVG